MKNIPPFKLVPEPLNEEAKNLPKFKWADDEIGTRHQLGGKPISTHFSKRLTIIQPPTTI